MIPYRTLVIAGLAALPLGCSMNDDAPVVGDGAGECYAANARDASAWIDKMPGPNDNPTLHIVFTVDAPNDGDAYELAFSASEESAPPGYVFDLVRVDEGILTVITETEVRHSWSSFPEPALRAVKINCGGEPMLEISPVGETH